MIIMIFLTYMSVNAAKMTVAMITPTPHPKAILRRNNTVGTIIREYVTSIHGQSGPIYRKNAGKRLRKNSHYFALTITCSGKKDDFFPQISIVLPIR